MIPCHEIPLLGKSKEGLEVEASGIAACSIYSNKGGVVDFGWNEHCMSIFDHS